MESLYQERKIELASYIAKLLDTMQLPNTARVVRAEAKINQIRDITKDVQQINNSTLLDGHAKKQTINSYFNSYIKRLIREGNFDEAMNVFERQLPRYVEDVEPFSLLFAESEANDSQQFNQILKQFIDDHQNLPNQRVAILNFTEQIWYIDVLGEMLILIDSKSNVRLVKADQVVAERSGLHPTIVYYLASNGVDIFATSGQDSCCRVWNGGLEMLYEVTRSQVRINVISLNERKMVTFDCMGNIMVHGDIPRDKKIIKNGLAYTKFKGRVYDDVKYLQKKNCFFACTFHSQGNRGQIDMIDIQRRKTSKKLTLNQRIFNIQISKCQKYLFLNLDISKIKVYTTCKFQLQFQFSGYCQRDYLMRMSVGGKGGNLLAMSSEDAEVCIFDTKHNKLTTKIRSVSGKPVNCVRWRGKQLFFGCDGGNYEHWSDRKYVQPKVSQKEEQLIIEQKEQSKLSQRVSTMIPQNQ